MIIQRVRRFGGFAANKIGPFVSVKFTKNKFGFFRTEYSQARVLGCNVGLFCLMYEY